MSEENPSNEETLIASFARRLNKHEKIIAGDAFTDPPKPGIQQVLEVIFRTLNDPEKGNEALHTRTRALETTDLKRVAWAGGVVWVVGIGIAAISFILGLLVEFLHHS